MEKSAYHRLDDSIESFVLIKQLSKKYWESVELEECWGFQIQAGSKWKKGLSEIELKEFEIQIGFQFPKPLKNFFRTMNGLDKPGLNNNGNQGEIEYGPTFYFFPDDIERIKSQIAWILEENKVSEKEQLSLLSFLI